MPDINRSVAKSNGDSEAHPEDWLTYHEVQTIPNPSNQAMILYFLLGAVF